MRRIEWGTWIAALVLLAVVLGRFACRRPYRPGPAAQDRRPRHRGRPEPATVTITVAPPAAQREVSFRRPMPQTFHRSTNTLSKVSIFGALFLVLGSLFAIARRARSACGRNSPSAG